MSTDKARLTRELFEAMRSGPSASAARAELISLHTGLAESCAGRYRGRGEPFEDLRQIAVSEADVAECLASSRAYATSELTVDPATNDPQLEFVEAREALRPLLDRLTDRQRTLLHQRFFEDRTQGEIAAELGVSQQQVARLLDRTLVTLRCELAL